jgi:lipopolysaccharide export system permease protein
VVIDGFTNVDAFQETTQTTGELIGRMGQYYAFQAAGFVSMTGTITGAIAVVVVFALLKKHGELTPVLAAGVPVWRLVRPVLACVLVVNLGVFLNNELVVPRIAAVLQAGHGKTIENAQKVESTYDFVTHIRLGGEKLYLAERRMTGAQFVLPTPEISQDLTTLKAAEATYHEATAKRPAGWHLKEVVPQFHQIPLTGFGQSIILPLDEPKDVFVATDVSFDRLVARNSSYRYVAIPELVRRIRNPAYGSSTVRGKLVHFHWRLMQPVANLLCIPLAIPVLLRKESYSLVTNVALTVGMLGMVFALCQAALFLGQAGLVSPSLAAWLPVVAIAVAGTWCASWVQT